MARKDREEGMEGWRNGLLPVLDLVGDFLGEHV